MYWPLRQICIGHLDKYELAKKGKYILLPIYRSGLAMCRALAKAALAAGFSIETFSGHKDKNPVPPRATDLNSWESNAFKT